MKQRKLRGIFPLLLVIFCLLFGTVPVLAEEEENQEEETEFIPEEYYDPIDTNEIPGWPKGEAVYAASAYVMDMDTGAVLYSKNAETKQYPASITKIMTCLVAVEQGNLDDTITFSEIVYDLEEGSSHAGIQPGEKMTMIQALEALMLESANDAANGIAEYLGGSLSGFADLMNEKARSLGCVNTHFTNPHGLHNEEHYTCARDMALIGRAAYENPAVREFMCTLEASCPPTNETDATRYFLNHHKMMQKDSEYYRDWCLGGKTGYTSDAWNTLVTFGSKNDLDLVCVVLREPGSDRTYRDTAALMEYGFSQFQKTAVGQAGQGPTFYEAMNLNYVGKAAEPFKSKALEQRLYVSNAGTAVIPASASVKDLIVSAESTGQLTRAVTYQMGGWTVGVSSMEFYPIPTGITCSFQQERDMDVLLKNASERKRRAEIEKTAMVVVNKAKGIYDSAVNFAEKNKLTVILVGSLILAVLAVMIFILFLRCTRETRMRKKRRQAEKQRIRREEEIDNMTMAEIEQELRAAMEEEQRRRQKQEEKIARQLKEEEKLRETEKMLDEINREKE